MKITGTDIDNLLPPVSRFGASSNNRTEVKNRVIEKLKQLFDKFSNL